MADLGSIFRPRAIAVIGASRYPDKVGHILVKNLLQAGYRGRVYPVNPNTEDVLQLKCYSHIEDIPDEVDLAVIAIPSELVLSEVEACGRKGVKSIIVISAGFKETGVEGAALEKELVKICRKYGMRLQGPNCLGVINTHVPLNLSFAAAMPKKGSIGFVSQSGALGTAVLDWVLKEDIGFGCFVSLGNKADLDEVDFIGEMARDPLIRVILVYVESIERGQVFVEIAAEVVRIKPLVVLKGGTSSAGARAAGSHTGAMVGSSTAYETAFRHSGVIVASSIEELFDCGMAFATQPIPHDDSVAIVTNAGGPGIIATDTCENLGVRLARLSEKTIQFLGKQLPPASNLQNPIDILGDARADRYGYAMRAAMEDDGVGSMLVLLTPQAMTESIGTAQEIIILAKDVKKPILTVFMGGERVEKASQLLTENDVPCFDFPEKAVRSLSAMMQYASLFRRPSLEPVRPLDVDSRAVRKIFEFVSQDGRVVLLPDESLSVLRAYGIRVPDAGIASTEEDAIRLAEKFGYPVALKVVSPDILHKSDVGGVALNLVGSKEVSEAFRGITTRVSRYMPSARVYGVLVSEMAPQGRELIIGSSKDVQFGSIMMFGLGGIYVNFLGDVSFRLAPVSRSDAEAMVSETKAFQLLRGVRGDAASDIAATCDALVRVSWLVSDFPEIVEIDVNPLFAYEEGKGCMAIDAKITLSKG